MVGNAWEWVADWYDKAYYQRSPERNPGGPDLGQYRVLRGGAWDNAPIYLRTSNRSFSYSHRGSSIGFRCAKGLP